MYLTLCCDLEGFFIVLGSNKDLLDNTSAENLVFILLDTKALLLGTSWDVDCLIHTDILDIMRTLKYAWDGSISLINTLLLVGSKYVNALYS